MWVGHILFQEEDPCCFLEEVSHLGPPEDNHQNPCVHSISSDDQLMISLVDVWVASIKRKNTVVFEVKGHLRSPECKYVHRISQVRNNKYFSYLRYGMVIFGESTLLVWWRSKATRGQH